MMKEINYGDIVYIPQTDQIGEVIYFGQDEFGQTAIQYLVGEKYFYTSAWLAFKYWIYLGSVK